MQPASNGVSFEETQAQINDLKVQYPSTLEGKAPKWWAAVLADGGGAFAGGEEGSIFGPWGTFAGALIGGVGASSIYAFGYPIVNPNNNTVPPLLAYSNLSNSFEQVGISHNKLLSNIMLNKSIYVNASNIIDTPAIYNKLKILTVAEWNSLNRNNPVTTNNISLTYLQFKIIVNNAIQVAATRNISVLNNTLSPDGQYLFGNYITGVSVYSDKTIVAQYTISYEHIVQNSSIDLLSKNKLLAFLATYRHSFNYWN